MNCGAAVQLTQTVVHASASERWSGCGSSSISHPPCGDFFLLFFFLELTCIRNTLLKVVTSGNEGRGASQGAHTIAAGGSAEVLPLDGGEMVVSNVMPRVTW